MPKQKRLIVTAEALNLRAAPGLDGAVVEIIPQGKRVRWLATSDDRYWHKVRHGARVGWASSKYLRAAATRVPRSRFPWFAIAYAELGVREAAEGGVNPRIVEYLSSTTLKPPYSVDDETPWCSAFANWCVERAGFAGTDSAWARSWLNWGKPVRAPSIGCITVFERNVTFGHVAFFLARAGDKIRVLGGNQSNAVSIAEYPSARLLGYRVPL